MEEIQEIPQEIQEIPVDNAEGAQDIAEEIKADEQPVPERKADEPARPKAKGRPRGSLNKGPSKPRAKKTQIKEAPMSMIEPLLLLDCTSPPLLREI